MLNLVHQLIHQSAMRTPHAVALRYKKDELSYKELDDQVQRIGQCYRQMGVTRHQRIAIYLEKNMEAVIALFAASFADAVFVPINPLLKGDQVEYILRDCHAKILVTSAERLAVLESHLLSSDAPEKIIVIGDTYVSPEFGDRLLFWRDLISFKSLAFEEKCSRNIDRDMAAILYTSGSTGMPKGVVISHRNLLSGAESVSEYLGNNSSDRILVALPLSFDYGLSQLTTAFLVGATAVLMNYLLPQDVKKLLVQEKITGLAAVPSLWTQLMQLTWTEPLSLRYITNSGGVMHRTTLTQLQKAFPSVQVFLMYGLTEAFRSTYLPPDQLSQRPESIGKAIPGAEILVLKQDGSPCMPNEPGELVHRGVLVTMGYWNDPEKTAERFRPLPCREPGVPMDEVAVWSGDMVRMDEEGYLYFIGRRDEMIKVSGYRISPTEIEEVINALEDVIESAVFGVSGHCSEQKIVLIARKKLASALSVERVRQYCLQKLPSYMLPSDIILSSERLPTNSNGKIDRQLLRQCFLDAARVRELQHNEIASNESAG